MIEPLLGIFLGISSLFFIIYLLQLIMFIRHKNLPSENNEQGVSVVVCAHNEYENLQRLVPALLTQHYIQKEIIIVDDRSSDDSYDFLLAQKPKIKLVRVDHVPDHANGKKYGLTLGIKAATYDRIIFTDADCIPNSENWLNVMAGQFTADKQFVLGYSQYIKKPGLLNLVIRFETLLTGLLYMTRSKLGRPYMGVGRNLAYRKSLFMEKKGFGRMLKITGGDDDLFINQYATKRNTVIALAPDALVLSEPKTNWKQYLTQKKRHLSVGKLYRLSDKLLLGGRLMLLTIFWLLFFILVVISRQPYILYSGFALKFLGQGLAMWSYAKKSGDKFDFWLLPVLDLWYLAFLAWMGTLASFSKKIKWS